MAARGFGFQTIAATAVAQPVFGTTLTAAINPTPDQYTGRMDPASNRSVGSVAVAQPTMFRKGDRAYLGTQEQIAAGAGDSAQVIAVVGSVVTLQGLTRAHASGEFIILSVPCSRVKIMAGPDNVAEMYLGEDYTVSLTSTTLFDLVDPSQRFWDTGPSGDGNVYETTHFWISGTAADTYLTSIVFI